MSRGYSTEQWVSRIGQQRASGLSIAAFCESIGVSQNAFHVRRRQISESREAPEPFVPLSITRSARVEFDLPCGATVRVSDADAVRCVMSVLLDDRGQA